MIKKLMAAFAGLVLSGAVAAESSGYYGVNVGYSWADLGGLSVDFGVAGVKFGSALSDMFSAEVRYNRGITSYQYGSETIFLDGLLSGLAVIGPTRGENRPYIAVGMTRASAKVVGRGYTVTDSDTDLAFGFGSTYYGKSDMGFNVEYMQYYNGDNITVSAVTIGFVTQF